MGEIEEDATFFSTVPQANERKNEKPGRNVHLWSFTTI